MDKYTDCVSETYTKCFEVAASNKDAAADAAAALAEGISIVDNADEVRFEYRIKKED